ncbi:hypothetical protein D3C74_196830 [compost metagenome]
MRRSVDIIQKYKSSRSLAEVPLEFVSEWHYVRNKPLTPSMVKPQSNKKVWWKCSAKHEWEASVQRRFLGDRCPFCYGKKVGNGRSLLDKFPLLVEEWNIEKNNFGPRDVLAGSSKKVWWKCNKGHEWEGRIDHRTRGSGCPICRKTNKKILS